MKPRACRSPRSSGEAEGEFRDEPTNVSGNGAAPSPSECTTAMLAHLGGFLLSVVLPAILMITQQEKSPFVFRHARERLVGPAEVEGCEDPHGGNQNHDPVEKQGDLVVQRFAGVPEDER